MSEKLNLKLEIYLPAKYDSDGDFQQDLLHKLVRKFGGLTILPNNYGIWLKPERKHRTRVVYDKITIIRIYTTEAFFYQNKGIDAFFNAIEQIKAFLKQNSIAYTINDKMEFY